MIQRLCLLLFLSLLFLPLGAGAQTQPAPVHLFTLIACEDQTNNVCRVEHQYTKFEAVAVDTLVKSGAGFVHTITCAGTDAAATAGDLAIRDGTAAGGGTVILRVGVAAAFFAPVTLILDVSFTTGLYLDFTTTSDVNCAASYR